MNLFSKKLFAGAFAVVSIISSVGAVGVLLDTPVTAVFFEREATELLWTIKVNGETVGVCSERDEAEGILQSFLDRYTTTDASAVYFLQDIEMCQTDASPEQIISTEELKKSLDPENSNSEYSLDVLTERRATEYRVTECETEYYDTDELYRGELQVTTQGVDLEEYVTMKVEYLNGREILRTDLYSSTVVEGVPEQVAIGITERPVTASCGRFIWPAQGVISSDFGYRSVSVGSSNHRGIDIAGEACSEIAAADGGEVIFAGENGGYGNLVKIRHDDGKVTFYAHCSSLCVTEGERVSQGQVIAYMGSTGVSTGTHLHFEVRVNDVAQDPMDYLP